MNTDPIADMLTRIRNANACDFETVKIPASQLKQAIADILVKNGYISKSELIKPTNNHSYLLLTLRYYKNKPIINGLKRVSKPGQRTYLNLTELNKMLSSKIEDLIVSTSQGLMTGREARKKGLGGEALFKIW